MLQLGRGLWYLEPEQAERDRRQGTGRGRKPLWRRRSRVRRRSQTQDVCDPASATDTCQMMKRAKRCVTAALWVAVVPWAGEAAEVTVAFEAVRGASDAREQVNGVVRAAVAPGPRVPFEAITGVIRDGTASVKLSAGTWSLLLESDSHWSPPHEISVAEGATPMHLTIQAWPTGLVRTRLSAEVDALVFAFRPHGSLPWIATASPHGEVSCRSVAGEWHCRLPAYVLDLEIRARGFMTHFAGRTEVRKDAPVDLPLVSLRAGASVVAWAQNPHPGPLLHHTEATIRPHTLPPATSHDRHQADHVVEVRADGFFQIGPLRPGRYELEVEDVVTGASESTLVDVVDHEETRLATPLLLRAPGGLRVQFEPELDATGDPWQVRLLAQGAEGGAARPFAKGPASWDGQWEAERLRPGGYILQVGDVSGATWITESLTVEAGSDPEWMRIPVKQRRVTGTVKLGSRPLQAKLVFGGRHAGVRLPIESDAEGRFSGPLPLHEFFDARGWPVYVEADAPPVRREIRDLELAAGPEAEGVTLDIVIPATALKGRVVRAADGTPPDRAVVTATHLDAKGNYIESLQVVSGGDGEPGRFEFAGLAPGRHALSAEAPPLVSTRTVVELSESGSVPEVTLVLEEDQPVRGNVLSDVGEPVAGATVFVIPTSRPYEGIRPVQTDHAGEFEARAAPEAGEVIINVVAPGFDYRMSRHRLGTDRWVTLQLSRGGGTLVLEAETPIQQVLGTYVWHAGSFDGIGSLARWASANGQRPAHPMELPVPRMPAGLYVACTGLLTIADAVGFVEGVFPDGRCSRGHLDPGGELRLKLPLVAPQKTQE
jgi:hypothetical protein